MLLIFCDEYPYICSISCEVAHLSRVVRRRGSGMIGLGDFIGHKVVIDYRTSNGKCTYAKGILVSVEGNKVSVNGPSRFWIIDRDMVLVCRVTNGKKVEGEPDSYMIGDGEDG